MGCYSLRAAASAAAAACAAAAFGQPVTGVPVLNSLPGASYTLYLDFAGFAYTGQWAGATPGTTPAFYDAVGSFTAAQQAQITEIWSRVAAKYAPYHVNVTTVDPAVRAGQADTDAHRQAYYDQTPQVMHTVIGGNGSWYPNAGGVSYVGVISQSYGTGDNNGAGDGNHTNWVFSDLFLDAHGIAEAGSHEDGHSFGLWHQSDYNGNNLVSEYSTNNGAHGNGSYAPIMGESYFSQRGTWRLGDADLGQRVTQNDPAVIQSNPNLGGFVDDSVSHSNAAPSELPVIGNTVDFTHAKGVITPNDPVNPYPIGAFNYTSDYWSFESNGGVVTLKAYDGSEYIKPGSPDPGGTLRSVMYIWDSQGNPVATAFEDPSTMFETFSGVLASGRYMVGISSYGGLSSSFDGNPAYYYDMGSYFLTGSGISAVPEPATFAGLGLGLLLFVRRRGDITSQ